MGSGKTGLILMFLTLFNDVLAYVPHPFNLAEPRPTRFPSSPSNKQRGLQTLIEWKELEYNFPSASDRSQAISRGLYVHGNGAPIDVDVHYGPNNLSRIFVTVPRFTTGIPFSLATISNIPAEGGPQLVAYPSYSWHSSHGKDCMGITSVFRVAIDECERLWVLDTGRIGSVQHCSPQILVFDLRTDTLRHRYMFPQAQFKIGVSLFVTPIVDVRDPPPRGTCRNTKVYIADVTGFGIVVYDFLSNTSWRMSNKLMYPYADFGTYTIAGESFDLMDGVIGLSLTPKQQELTGGSRPHNFKAQERYLYFHSLAAAVENRVALSLVDNATTWDGDEDSNPRDFNQIGSRNTQSAAQAMDSMGNLYFGLMDDIAIAAWNINTPYSRNNFKIVAQNRDTLQFVSGLKVKKSRQNTEELWALSNRFQKVFAGTKNSREVNFRIMGCNTFELFNGGCRGGSENTVNNFIFKN